MTGNKLRKVAQNMAFFAVLGVVCTTAAIYFGLQFAGISLYTINSPSMKPSLSPGDVVGIRAVDPWEIEEGDVVAYVKDGVPVVHRVAEVRWVGYDVITNIKKPDGTVESEVTQRQPREFVFRGDNNPADDSDVVQQTQIIGRQSLEVPRPFSWAATSFSRETLIAFGVLAIAAYVAWELTEAAAELRRRRRTSLVS
ncbi:signal peptidase I [Candidatus Amarobacter glycogenicus]|uniref:signal peptidase I n=1 Tax=Candidatus Amarobacter glycogenicus TaxID=3140699 RepID=UPI002A16A38A|nr:signal peptidase I [Dehalococcoidia bacterium]